MISDMIFVVKEGDIIKRDVHEELLAQNGFYSDLCNGQFEQHA